MCKVQTPPWTGQNMSPLSTRSVMNTKTIPKVISLLNSAILQSRGEHRTSDCQIQGAVRKKTNHHPENFNFPENLGRGKH